MKRCCTFSTPTCLQRDLECPPIINTPSVFLIRRDANEHDVGFYLNSPHDRSLLHYS
jgi:hypothetical protein